MRGYVLNQADSFSATCSNAQYGIILAIIPIGPLPHFLQPPSLAVGRILQTSFWQWHFPLMCPELLTAQQLAMADFPRLKAE